MTTGIITDRDQLRSSIEEAIHRFTEAISRGDARAVAELYTDDAHLLPADAPMQEGRAAVQAFWGGAIQQGGLRAAKLEIVHVESAGDLAYEIGRFTLTFQPAGAASTSAKGKYVVVWKQVAGGWKIHVDIWNGDGPAQ